jgi:chemotaxis protein MotB
MSDDERRVKKAKPGIPAWMATFADLMTLLMCFFVLLLSFSEMDVIKFKRLAGSMSEAFGVQRQLVANEMPMGTSIVAQEFSPGRPQPTPIDQIYQQTDETPDLTLEVPDEQDPEVGTGEDTSNEEAREQIQAMMEETKQDAVELASELEDQIARGEVEIETEGRKIIIRIREKGSFAPASAELAPEYRGVMGEVAQLLATKPGQIQVQGHTDDRPIATPRFRSNWELSSSRAVSVAHELIRDGRVPQSRLTVSGFADTRPLVDNDSPESRARNRRVEIVLNQGFDQQELEALQRVRDSDPVFYDSLEIEDDFNILPGEVF